MLTDSRVVCGGVVRLLRDGEGEEVGVHADFGVRLVDCRHTGGEGNDIFVSHVKFHTAAQGSALWELQAGNPPQRVQSRRHKTCRTRKTT